MAIKNEDHILAILTRYLEDDVEQDERNFVGDWIAESDTNKEYFKEVKLLWEASKEVDDFDKIDVKEEWAVFSEKVASSSEVSPKRNINRAFLKIAASVAIIISLSVYFMNSFNSEITLIAQSGQENKFELPDQSIVWLKEGSTLTYEKGFEGDVRRSQLKGEAFFEVTKNPEKPFEVLTNGTKTKVLGTSFNLRTDIKTQETELVLVTGKVQFTSKNHQEILVPGDKITAKSDGELVKKSNDNPNFISWKSKVLKFEDAVMSIVIKDIEQFYKVKLVFENPQLANCTLTSVFENESIEDVLETLTVIFDITYKKLDSNRILIKGGDCNS